MKAEHIYRTIIYVIPKPIPYKIPFSFLFLATLYAQISNDILTAPITNGIINFSSTDVKAINNDIAKIRKEEAI